MLAISDQNLREEAVICAVRETAGMFSYSTGGKPMRLLKDNAISLAKAERKDFFAVYSPSEKDADSKDRVEIVDPEEASWVKFAFESKIDEASGVQKRVLSRAAAVLGELCCRLRDDDSHQDAETMGG